MLWTIFMISIAVWMMGLVFHFGGSVLPLLLVVAAIVLVMNHMFAADLSDSNRSRDAKKSGKFNFTTAEQFAGASSINPSSEQNQRSSIYETNDRIFAGCNFGNAGVGG